MLFQVLSAHTSSLSVAIRLKGVLSSKFATLRLSPSLYTFALSLSTVRPQLSFPLMERILRSILSSRSSLRERLQAKPVTDMCSGSNPSLTRSLPSTSYERRPSYINTWFMRRSTFDFSFSLSRDSKSKRNCMFSASPGAVRLNLTSGAASATVFTLISPFSSLAVCK